MSKNTNGVETSSSMEWAENSSHLLGLYVVTPLSDLSHSFAVVTDL